MSEENQTPQGLEVRTYFVRERNALVARADFGEMYVDYYLHQSTLGHRPAPGPDAMLKDALAALTLHCASRPWNETTAWTIHFADPLVNLFVTGDNNRGAVVGQLFTDNVKRDGRSVFISDVLRGTGQPRRSIVELQDADVFHAVERYYEQSEQSPARLFRHGDEDFVMVSAHPDCDLAWFEAIVPCGIADAGVTSMARLPGEAPAHEAVEDAFLDAFARVFHVTRRAPDAAVPRMEVA